jgi:glutaminyl-tRNA synthetase
MEDVRWLGSNGMSYAMRLTISSNSTGMPSTCHGAGLRGRLSVEEIREYRGTLTEPGRESPFRDRPAEESLQLFARMKAGEFEDGKYVLRARIDMASGNINLRDPVIYRIRNAVHHRTGDTWHIYPMYDWAHGISDAIEGITHSLCTLEFEDHRPLYDWILENIPSPSRPRQIEFARGNIDYTVMSKRRLRQLVEEGHVSGWDDPRMPNLAGMRRRFHPPRSSFWNEMGISSPASFRGVLENGAQHLNVHAQEQWRCWSP